MDLFSVVETLEHLHNMGVKFFFIESPPLRMRDQVRSDVDHPIETDDSNRNILEPLNWNGFKQMLYTTDDEFTPSSRHGNNHYFERNTKRNCDTFIDSEIGLTNDKLGN